MLVTELNYRCSVPGRFALESSCGLFLALPLCAALSQWEKRLVVRRPISPALVPCRIAWWPFVFASVDKLLLEPLSFLYSKTCSVEFGGDLSTALTAFMIRLTCMMSMSFMIRLTCMMTGLYLGQSFFPLALTGSIATGMCSEYTACTIL
jgi:hypothetical protein